MAKQKQDRWANAQSMGLDALEQSGFRFNPPKAQEPAAPDGAEPASRPLMSLSRGSLLNDLVTEGVNAAASGVSSVGKFISPGNSVSKVIDTFVEDSQGNFTDVAKQGKQAYEQEMQAAEGVGDEVAATWRYVANNPGMAAAQFVGSFAGPGAAIKGAGLGARAMRLGATGATRAGLGAGAVVGGTMAGGDAAGTAYDLVLKAGGTPEQAEAAARDASVIPGAIGAAGGLVGAERLFAGGKGFAGNMASRALKTGAVEGLQEGVEEGVTQYEGQRAAVPYDPSIDPMRGVGGAATMGAVMGGATGGGISLITGEPAKAGDPIRDLKTGGTGTLARAADTGLEHQARQADAGISEGQFNAAMTAMEGQAADDQKGIKAAGRADKTGFAGQAPRASMAQTMGAMGDVGSTEEVSALTDRIMLVKESLADPTTRDFIRQNLGEEAFNEATYYANQADKPGAIPDQTRDNMLAMAEAIVSRARLTPIRQPGAMGTNVGPAPEALGAPQGVPAIGLDTTPTGAFRVDAAGNAAPEVNADVINTKQAKPARDETLGQQARKASAVWADPAPKPAAAPKALPYDTSPTGRMVAGADGVAAETNAQRINRQQARSVQPGDRTAPSGKPFKNLQAAKTEQRRNGGAVVEVNGGWVVRAQADDANQVRFEMSVGEAKAPAGTQVAIPQKLNVTFGGKTYPVESIADAQRKWIDFQNKAGTGVSEVGNGVRIADQDGKFVARISFNGRVWDGEGDGANLIAEAPASSPASAPKTSEPQRAPAFLRKTLPEMSDEELSQAGQFYGADHPRASKVKQEVSRRARKAAAEARKQPKPEQVNEQDAPKAPSTPAQAKPGQEGSDQAGTGTPGAGEAGRVPRAGDGADEAGGVRPAKVFKTKVAAEKARDELGNTHQVQKVKGGYKVRAKTAKEIAAQTAAGQRLKAAKAPDAEGDSLLTAIAKLGGLAMSEKADTITEGNKNAGGRMVFQQDGKPIDLMAQALHEDGYIPPTEFEDDGGISWLRSAISDEFGGLRKHYSMNGEEWMRRRFEQAQGDAPDYAESGIEDADLEQAGYFDADEDVQAAVDAIANAALDEQATLNDDAEDSFWASLGDFERQEDEYARQQEQAAADAKPKDGSRPRDAEATDTRKAQTGNRDRQETGGQVQEGLSLTAPTAADALKVGLGDFNAQADKLASLPAGSWLLLDGRQSDGDIAAFNVVMSLGGGRRASGDTSSTPAEAFKSGLKRWTDRGGAESQFKQADKAGFISGTQNSLLTSPTRADIEAQQDRAEQADALDEKAQAKRESEVGDSTFMTGFSGDGRQDNTADLFAQGAQEQDQQAATGGIAGATAGGSRSEPGGSDKESLNKPHTISSKQVLTPTGAIKADARNSKADSSIWYYQGDIKMLAMTASVSIDGQPAKGAEAAKNTVLNVSAAQKAGWGLRSYRAGTLGTVWTLSKGGEFLTRAGLENITSSTIKDPKIDNRGAGYEGMVSAQKDIAKALFSWLNTLPAEQRENQAVVSRKMSDVLGGWAFLERDKLGLHVRYKPADSVRWMYSLPVAETWAEALTQIEGLAGQKFTDAKPDQAPAEQSPEPTKVSDSKTPMVDRHTEAIKAVRGGTASVGEYQSAFASITGNPEAVKVELNTMNKEALLRAGGLYFYQRHKSDTKAEVVDAMYGMLVNEYALGKDYGPKSYMLGAHKAHQAAKDKALRELVEGQTAETLADFAAEVKKAEDEYKAERAAKQAAMDNPQTLSDYRSLLSAKIREGMTRAEAFLTLTPEQRIKYDELEAEGTRESREAAKRAAKTAVRSAGQTTAGEIVATKHTRDGHDLWVVKLADRLSTDDYRTVLASAKRLGGSYSSFRGNGAVPGFQFRNPEAAQAFLKLAGGDTTEAQGLAEQRRDAFDDDRSQSAVERLREMADKLEERAQEAIDRDRKTNTARRARFAASADREAQESKALAQTMRNIAQAIEEGRAKFLDGVRTKTQVELLRNRVATAKQDELRAKHPSYADQEKRRGEPATPETADFAEFPSFSAFRSDLASLARQMLEVEGTKKLGQRLMSVADDVTDAYIEFAKKPENLYKLSTFSIRQGEDVKAAILPSKDAAERAIRRSGLADRAIVLAEKRGVNRIIMSPSEAMSRGVWTGDGDKRITLTPEFGAELVQAIGRRGNKTNRLTVPWQFQTAHDRLNALKRIGVETPSEYRSALREFIGLQERAIVNKVREMELSMVGRKNDGLDFFPTPAEVADQMVAAADISPDMAVLEPSAGMGHIADRIREAGAEPDVIEFDEDRAELLREKGYHHVSGHRDFMTMEPRKFFTYGDVFRAPDGTEGVMQGTGGMGSNRVVLKPLIDGVEVDYRRGEWYNREDLVGVRHRGSWSGYDRIIMNPPFSNGRDIEHVMHAYDLLKPGGRIVAIMGESAFFNQSKKAEAFRQWLDDKGGTSEKLPAGSFMDPSLPVNTGVNARMVVIDKPDVGEQEPGNFSRSPEDESFYRSQVDYEWAPPSVVNRVKQQVESLRTFWKNSPEVVVLASFADAPEAMQRLNDQQMESGAVGEPEGFFYKGKAYLLAPHMKSPEDVRRVLFHETLGHLGLRGVFGDGLNQILDQLWATRKADVEERAAAYGLQVVNAPGRRALPPEQLRTNRRKAAEEVLAKMAETRPEIGFVRRALAIVKQWLRKHVPGFAKMRMTDAEITANFLMPAQGFIERGQGAEGRQLVPAFSRADEVDTGFSRTSIADATQAAMNAGQAAKEWAQSPETKSAIDDLVYVLQDRLIDTKRVVKAAGEQIGKLSATIDPYLQEELFHGRATQQTEEFLRTEVQPLLRQMAASNLTMTEVEKYLHARHAPERNAAIAKINPDMPDGGSGMKTAEAKAYMDSLNPQKRATLDRVAARVDAITSGTRKHLLDTGLESAETIASLGDAYKHYVPLQREDVESGGTTTGTGPGFSIKGTSIKRAMGSDKGVVDILANLVMQRERAITRAEKNRVSQALYGLSLKAPNRGFWIAIDPNSAKGDEASRNALMNDLKAMGLEAGDADAVAREPLQRFVDPSTGIVSTRVNPALRSRDNVVSARFNGVDRFVIFNEGDAKALRMAKALKNLDTPPMGALMGWAAKFTRYFAAVNTQYNPVFGIINLMRDTQGAMVNLSTTPLSGKQKEVASNVLPILREVFKLMRARRAGEEYTSDLTAVIDDFEKAGGKTGWRDSYATSQDRAEALKNEIEMASDAKTPRLVVMRSLRTLGGLLTDYNDALENCTRVSAYKVAIEQGLSKEDAASLAKNLTVNFNRKGAIGSQAGALYAFFNASVQGSARLAETLAGPLGKKILQGGMLLGVAQAMLLAGAGFDDGEPPDFVVERAFVIPTGDGKYLSVPMPLGLHILPNLGRITTQWGMSDFKDTGKRVVSIMGLLADSFNPIGNAGMSVQTLTPTILDPLVALSENKDFAGRPIARKDLNPNEPTPGFTRAKDTSTWLARYVAEGVNWLTGGTSYKPGAISPTPDQIDYLLGEAGGGVFREASKVWQTGESASTGAELPSYKIPLVGRLIGDTNESASQASKFYENLKQLNEHEAEIKGRTADGGDVEAYLAENPEAGLYRFADQVQKRVANLRKLKRRLTEEGRPASEVQSVEKRITAEMLRLNERVRAAKAEGVSV